MRLFVFRLFVLLGVLGFGSLAFAAPIIDTTTQGNWITVYGTDGFVLPHFNAPDDLVSLPSYVSGYTLTGTRGSWAFPTTDPRALVTPANTTQRRANYNYANTSFDLTVNLNRPKTFDLSFYMLDWDSYVRQTRISNVPGHADETVTNYHDGKWYRYQVSGDPSTPVTARFTALASNAVVSAVMFDTDAQIDTATKGSWIGQYGSQGYILAGFTGSSDVTSLPSWVQSYTLSGNRYAWTTNTTDVRALVNPSDPNNRRANCAYDSNQLNFHLDVKENVVFDMAVYALDWDSYTRAGVLQLAGFDDTRRPIVGFHDGLWHIFRVHAAPNVPLDFSFSRISGGNITLSAIMFGNVQFVPEPSSMALWVLGVLAWFVRRRIKIVGHASYA